MRAPSPSKSSQTPPIDPARADRFVSSLDAMKVDNSQSTGRKFDLRPKAKSAA